MWFARLTFNFISQKNLNIFLQKDSFLLRKITFFKIIDFMLKRLIDNIFMMDNTKIQFSINTYQKEYIFNI